MDRYQEIAAYYDIEHDEIAEDIGFYLNILTGGPVLEVGAGTGRVMLPLIRGGLEVWGVDSSPAMLGRARTLLAGLPGAHLIETPIEQLNLGTRFRAAIFSLNSLWHLPSSGAQLDALAAVRRHLLPDSLLIIDLTNPLTMADRGANGEVRRRFERQLEGHTITGFSAATDDEGEQRLTLPLWYDDIGPEGLVCRASTTLHLRYLYRSELELLARLSGFAPRQLYGSYDLEPYTAQSQNIILLAD